MADDKRSHHGRPPTPEKARALAQQLAWAELKRLEKDSQQTDASGGIVVPSWVLKAFEKEPEQEQPDAIDATRLTQDELLMSRYLDLKLRDGAVPADLDPRADIEDGDALLGPAAGRASPASG